jgi:hypothetical protein
MRSDGCLYVVALRGRMRGDEDLGLRLSAGHVDRCVYAGLLV